ncbi:MAG: fluoride efflux transporter CrcB [Spirochaetales bacterium]|nr:fluoride efflux transporter CrcB [Spirochaetales bacterium]
MKYVLIFLGSGAGGLSRYILSTLVYDAFPGGFPVGTLAVNWIGCFLIGFLSALFGRFVLPPDLRLFVFVGFLGGFTTFSAFGLETYNLLRERELPAALLNFLLANGAGIVLVFAGFLLFQIMIKVMR